MLHDAALRIGSESFEAADQVESIEAMVDTSTCATASNASSPRRLGRSPSCRCAGLDVHKKEAVASLRLTIRKKSEVRPFSTTRGLLELEDWLEQSECNHVAMEAERDLLEAGLAHAEMASTNEPLDSGVEEQRRVWNSIS